jgi:serine/threonine protein kinase/predicted negative regulator of RcsB-dependent stress response
MTPDQWSRLKRLFHEALERPSDQRSAFIREVEARDAFMGRRLAALLQAHQQQTGPVDRPDVDTEPLVQDDPPAFVNGELIADRFEIVRFLGRGGMGEVYEANDIHLGRIALKTIRPEIAGHPDALARFRNEVLAARDATGPNVCRIHELFIVPAHGAEKPTAFLTMEFLEGITLADRIDQDGALPVKEARAIAAQLCAGLQTIHDAGIIHRDLKSRNIMLARRNDECQAVVMDFGLARRIAGVAVAGSSRMTVQGTVVGTPEYMAPEQFQGLPLTPAADIYALGIVLYEMVTGRLPFDASTPAAAAAQRAKWFLSASSVRPGLGHRWDRVIEHCLRHDPDRRYKNAAEVAEALSHSSSIRNFEHKLIARPVRAVTGISVCFALALLFWYRSGDYHPPSDDALEWYSRGVAALREGTYLKATNALQMATDRDPNYVLAHARLADAWNELDFPAKAKDEMLKASSLQLERNLPELDKQYIEAVRDTILRDFPAALRRYQRIFRDLPRDMKAYGEVDLGRAYEKAGDPENAARSYSEAKRLAPDYPASYVRLGILDSRGQARPDRNPEAEFARAETLYRAASNLEGVAEVEYQRGYAANRQNRPDDGERFLKDSLRTAQAIPSVQLEVRALAQLSAAEYLRELSPGAVALRETPVELANRAVTLARDNGMEYWATDGIIRLGSAYFAAGDYGHAEVYFKQGLQLAEASRRPRLEALAELNLATLRDQQGRADDVISLAQRAVSYYRPANFFVESTQALILIARAKLDKAEFREALQRGRESLALTAKAGNPALVGLAEEVTGDAFLKLQNYPEALAHFQFALKANPNEYNTLHCADALWRLGRYREAEQTFATLPADVRDRPDLRAEIDGILADMRLSQKKYRMASDLARTALRKPEEQSPAWILGLQVTSAKAEYLQGHVQSAEHRLEKILSDANLQAGQEVYADAKLALAAVYAAQHSPQRAKPLAEAANAFFASTGQKESECLSLLALARIQRALGDGASAQKSAAKALDILSEFEHNWSISNRPDLREASRELIAICRH